ncbi:MAG: GvpL/GvpF family gas vesicle protein [Thermacetogeniaceae bacterium]
MSDSSASSATDTAPAALQGCYLYCVAPVFDLVGLNIRGLDDVNVHQISIREIGAVVHDCPAVPYEGENEQARAWLLVHHAVIDAIWERVETVLPMTFDVIIKGDSRQSARAQVAAWLEENYESFRDKLSSLRGKAELAIQVNWDRKAVLREIIAADSEVKQLQSELQGKPKGLAFFYQQKMEKLIRQKADSVVDELCQASLRKIQALSVQTCVNKPKRLDGLEMLLNLSVLADKANISAIGAVLGDLQARQGMDIHFTGPWPPYSFAMASPVEEPDNQRKR